ncbi:MAG TPA: cyclic nucleotide-binding domain-containing protein [Gaiellaceae bacterium]|nr:cyclic nucleotide-binding domain-containing protein [Gaiellaceae bacterium]
MDAKRLEGIPLFSTLSRREREQVAQWADEVTVDEGRELAREGSFAHEFFVIEDGAAEVRQDGSSIGELGPGDFFGEIGLLETERRTASVVATTPLTAIVMFQREFRQMERELPDVADKIRAAIRARLSE